MRRRELAKFNRVRPKLKRRTQPRRPPRDLSRAAACRNEPRMIGRFLNDALATGDTATFFEAVGDILRVQGMSEAARKVGLTRASLYRSFGGKVSPHADTFIRTLAALELELVVKPAGRS
jgi:probable addiction module antidote protein